MVLAASLFLTLGEFVRPGFTGERMRLAFLSFALATVCAGWARRVPPQNVGVVTSFLVLSGLGCAWVLSLGGSDHVGSKGLGPVARASVGLLWSATALSSRGMAMKWLWPHVHRKTYGGIWVLAATIVLTCLMLAMWSTIWPVLGGWLWWLVIPAMALGSMLLCTPWLIPKQHAYGGQGLRTESMEKSMWGMASVWVALALVALAGVYGAPH